MKVRTTIAGTVLSTRLTAAGFGVLAVLASAGLSACSGGSSSTTPAIFSPSVNGSATATGTASSGTGSGTTPTAGTNPSSGSVTAVPTVIPTVTVTPSPTVTFSPAPTPSPSASIFPTTAPLTGGGGTAGVQDVLLFGFGGAAIVAGAGSIAYRRKLTKRR